MDITHDRAAWGLIGGGALVALSVLAPLTAVAETTEPIRIGVIGEESSVAGASLTKSAALAADDIKMATGLQCRMIVADVDEYERLLKRTLLHFPGVGSVNSSVALKQIKQTTKIAI